MDHAIEQGRAATPAPAIRTIGFKDLKDALRKGVGDFQLMRSHLIMLALIYPLIGLVAAQWSTGNGVLPMLFPLASGFALVGPVAAVGLYELSRRREKGLDTSWKHVFDVVRSPALGTIVLLSIMLAVIFLAWVVVAMRLYTGLFGSFWPISIERFIAQLFGTGEGWRLILFGNAIGFLFAVVTLAVSAVSFPMALDRNADFFTAVGTSVRAFMANPGTMLAWGFIVAAVLVIAAIPFLVGLAVAMPILGHATWHLYRKLIA